jgi:hypothetical protein
MEVDGAAAKPSSTGPGPMNEGLGPATAARMEGRFADMCKVQALGCCGFFDARLGRAIGWVLKFIYFSCKFRFFCYSRGLS